MTNASLIRKYLLGELTPEERTRIEDEYFADVDKFEELIGAENDLIDSYVRGTLSDSERQQFEHHYRNLPNRRGSIDFAKALSQAVQSERETIAASKASPWEPLICYFRFPSSQFRWALAVAAGVLIGVLLLGLQDYRLRRELQEAQSDVAQLRGQQGALRAQIAALSGHEPRAPESQEGNQVAQLQSPTDLPFRLVPGVLRGGTVGQRDLVIPPSGAWVRLEMVLDRDEFKTYEAVLQTPEGKDVLRGKGLKSLSIGRSHVVRWRVPSQFIQPGDYAVRLKGETNGVSVEEAESYSLRAVRK